MPNGTYGGVRGRKTKVGRKLSFSSYSILFCCPGHSVEGGHPAEGSNPAAFGASPTGWAGMWPTARADCPC